MSAVELLAYSAQSASDVGAAVAVGQHAVLRLTTTITANLGTEPYVDLYIETAPVAAGPWTIAKQFRYDAAQPSHAPTAWPAVPPTFTIGDVSAFARVRWAAGARRNGAVPALVLGVAGEGKPDAV